MFPFFVFPFCKYSQFLTVDRMYTNIIPSLLFFFFFFQLVHRQTQFTCTIHSLTSVHAHLDRTGLESIVFFQEQLQSYCHVVLIHGSGAGLLRTVD